MKTYYFSIKQNFGGCIDGQNVWTRADSLEEARRNIEREYHSVIGITLIRVK